MYIDNHNSCLLTAIRWSCIEGKAFKIKNQMFHISLNRSDCLIMKTSANTKTSELNLWLHKDYLQILTVLFTCVFWLLWSLDAGTPVPFELNPVLGILIGVVAVLLVVAIVIVGALRLRAQNRGSPSRPGDLALKEKAALPLRSNVEDLYEMDDKNPDVIPCNKGKAWPL